MTRSKLFVLSSVALAIVTGCSGSTTDPGTQTFTATLNGASERPTPITTPATGSGSFSLSADGNTLTWNVTTTGANNVVASNSALGSLFYKALGLHEPNTAVPIGENTVGPFRNFQPYLYWSASKAPSHPQNTNGFNSFSFNTGYQGSNVSPNYLYVLPMIRDKLPGTQTATGKKLEIAADGQAVYDPVEKVTWLANANFAAGQTFGVANINPDGSMEHSTALLWVKAMNKGAGYLRSLRFTASV